MRKLLLSMILLLTGLCAQAQLYKTWKAPSVTDYPDEMVVYTQVFVNGEEWYTEEGEWLNDDGTKYTTIGGHTCYVAAFIDGECRAMKEKPIQFMGADGKYKFYYQMRILGDMSEDAGKEVVFKVYNGHHHFEMTKTVNFSDDTYRPIPLVLNIDEPTSWNVDVDDLALDVNQTFNIMDHIVYDYKSLTLQQDWTPLGESKMAEPFEFTFEVGEDAAPYMNISKEGVLTAIAPCNYQIVNIKCKHDVHEQGYYGCPCRDYRSTILVTVNPIKVTGIDFLQNPIEVNVGDNVLDLIYQITVLTPSNATDKKLRISMSNDIKPLFVGDNLQATTAGTYTFNVYSNDFGVRKSLTVIVKAPAVPIAFTYPSTIQLERNNDAYTQNFMLLTVTGDGDFDPTLVSCEPQRTASNGELPLTMATNPDNDQRIDFTPLHAGVYTIKMYYDGKPMLTEDGDDVATVKIINHVRYNPEGWSWITYPGRSPFFTNYGDWFDRMTEDSYIEELRSQTGLLFFDPSLGMTSDFEELNITEGMYKMKAHLGNDKTFGLLTIRDEVDINILSTIQKPLQKGYNWVGYPNEFNCTMDYWTMQGGMQPGMGDMMIGKNGFAEWNGLAWIGTDGFELEEGKGYIYYMAAEPLAQTIISFPNTADPSYAPATSVKGDKEFEMNCPWTVDDSRFADCMALTAEVSNLRNPEHYVLGAFVGNECRGKGICVQDGVMMLSVAGKSGEKLNFRLFNKFTGEIIELDDTMKYGKKEGSLQAPARLTSTLIETGIMSVNSTSADDDTLYDLSGRKVMKAGKGIYVQNGKKVLK